MKELKRKANHQTVMLILASASEGRKLILEELGTSFFVDVSNIDEASFNISDVEKLVMSLATEKAFSVAKKYKDAIVIGADTVVYHQGEIIGKPLNGKEAEKILLKLSDSTHQVITGVTLVDVRQNRVVRAKNISDVTFVPIPLSDIKKYVATGEAMGRSGAYASQGLASKFIKTIVGDPTNVVGLPKDTLLTLFGELELYLG